jgi:L-rhamnose mutarotase
LCLCGEFPGIKVLFYLEEEASLYIYTMITRYCLALDIQDNPAAIAAYDEYHKKVWPEIKESISTAGIRNMDIYRTGNRLFMVMEVEENFSFEKKAAMDRANPKVKEWEDLMWTFLQPLPHTGGKRNWILMERVFSLRE